MAKGKRKTGIQRSKNKNQLIVEEQFDDSLLPDAAEIERLQLLDPDIFKFLKDRAIKEQDFRHDVVKTKIELVAKQETGSRWINYLGLMLSFLLLLAGMGCSVFLIMNDHDLVGSIFIGATLLSVIGLFMSKVQNNNTKQENKS